MGCEYNGEVWYESDNNIINEYSFTNLYKKEFQLIKKVMYSNDDTYRELIKTIYQYQVNDFVRFSVYQPSRGRFPDYNCYFGQIVDMYYTYETGTRMSYDILLLENNSLITLHADGDNFIWEHLPYDMFTKKIELNIELREKKIESLRKATEVVITKILQKNIIVS